jgi:serine/threonine protein kinase
MSTEGKAQKMGNLTHENVRHRAYTGIKDNRLILFTNNEYSRRTSMAEFSSASKGPDAYRAYIGASLGEYRLDQVLAESDAGPIFLARSKQASFQLQLLTVAADLPSQDRIVLLGRFQREANLVAALQHPGILPLLDYGIYQSLPYLVMPYLPARTLSSYLAKHGALDTLLASRYLDQIAAALEYAHAQAALHLSLSADCIFLKEDKSLIITGFGIVRMLQSDTSPTPQTPQAQEQQNRFLLHDKQGRALYGLGPGCAPAPEQLLGNPVDTFTDVYALAAVLYRMLTGHRVFQGSPEELAQQHLSAPVPPISKWRAGTPPQIDAIIAKAMAKDPRQRFLQPGLLANAYHDCVAPNDTQRKAFPVRAPAPIPALASDAPARNIEAPLAPPPRPPAASSQGTKRRPAGNARGAAISRRNVLIAGGSAAAAIIGVTVFASHYLIGNTTPTGTTTTSVGSTSSSSSSGSGGHSGSGGTGGHTGTVIAHTSDVPINSAKTFPIPNQSNPGVLVHLPDNRFVAFNSTCTHAGCAVAYNSQDHLLECPCHGAAFDPAKGASVVTGPAPTPLASIPITVNSDNTITEG